MVWVTGVIYLVDSHLEHKKGVFVCFACWAKPWEWRGSPECMATRLIILKGFTHLVGPDALLAEVSMAVLCLDLERPGLNVLPDVFSEAGGGPEMITTLPRQQIKPNTKILTHG